MKEFHYTIQDELGIHARPAGHLSKLAKTFPETVITVTRDGETVKASQLMKLMNLGIKKGDTVTVSASGAAEDDAIAAMEKFFAEKFVTDRLLRASVREMGDARWGFQEEWDYAGYVFHDIIRH